VKYRRPFGTEFEDLDLNTAMNMIANRVLAARRHGWQWKVDGIRTRRTLGFAGPAIGTYTAALICDTAVPSWHDGYREMPYLFAGSASGASVELVAKQLMMRRLAAAPGSSPRGAWPSRTRRAEPGPCVSPRS
jgi:hypothetical protein